MRNENVSSWLFPGSRIWVMVELATERNEHWLAQELDLGNQRLLASSPVLGRYTPPTSRTAGAVSRVSL